MPFLQTCCEKMDDANAVHKEEIPNSTDQNATNSVYDFAYCDLFVIWR